MIRDRTAGDETLHTLQVTLQGLANSIKQLHTWRRPQRVCSGACKPLLEFPFCSSVCSHCTPRTVSTRRRLFCQFHNNGVHGKPPEPRADPQAKDVSGIVRSYALGESWKDLSHSEGGFWSRRLACAVSRCHAVPVIDTPALRKAPGSPGMGAHGLSATAQHAQQRLRLRHPLHCFWLPARRVDLRAPRGSRVLFQTRPGHRRSHCSPGSGPSAVAQLATFNSTFAAF